MKQRTAKRTMNLLKQLCEVHAPSGEEWAMKEFLLKYIQKENKNWKTKPEIYHGEDFQDCIVLAFGKPRAAVHFEAGCRKLEQMAA